MPEYHRFVASRPCPKCGAGPTPAKFCSERMPGGWRWGTIFHPYMPEEHLHRQCLSCGHERIELAMDAPLLSAERRAEAITVIQAQRQEIIDRQAEAFSRI